MMGTALMHEGCRPGVAWPDPVVAGPNRKGALMAQNGAGLTVTSQGRKPQTDQRAVTGDELRRLDRLAPLLHELLDWGLVHPTDSGTFELRADVQERLRQLSASRPVLEAQVYVAAPAAGAARWR